MAISRLKTWLAGEVLTAADLNAEFNNLTGGGVALVSPLTGSLAAGGFDVTGLDELAFDDAATAPSATGRLRRNSTVLAWRAGNNSTLRAQATDANSLCGVSFVNDAQEWLIRNDGSLSDALAFRDATGGATRVTLTPAGVLAMGTGGVITPAAVSGTPAANSVFRESVTKGWVTVSWSSGTPSIDDSFNVSSITDEATGDVSVTWDRDFANANYAAVATARHSTPNIVATATAKAVGSARFVTTAGANAVALDVDGDLSVIAIGDQ